MLLCWLRLQFNLQTFLVRVLKILNKWTELFAKCRQVNNFSARNFKCWVLFEKKIGKLNKQEDGVHDPCLHKLCNDILNGLADGHVYNMGCAWSQYVNSCPMENVNIAQKCLERTYPMTCVNKHVSRERLTNKSICWSTQVSSHNWHWYSNLQSLSMMREVV